MCRWIGTPRFLLLMPLKFPCGLATQLSSSPPVTLVPVGFLWSRRPPLNLQPLHPLTLRWMYAGVFCSVRAPLPPLMRNRLRLTRLYTMVRLTFYLRLCTALVMSPRDKLLRRLL